MQTSSWHTDVMPRITGVCVVYDWSSKKHCYPLKLRCCSSLLHQLKCRNFREIVGTSLQHFRWLGERCWASVVAVAHYCLFGAYEKAPQVQICPKTFVYDCRYPQYFIVQFDFFEIGHWLWSSAFAKHSCDICQYVHVPFVITLGLSRQSWPRQPSYQHTESTNLCPLHPNPTGIVSWVDVTKNGVVWVSFRYGDVTNKCMYYIISISFCN